MKKLIFALAAVSFLVVLVVLIRTFSKGGEDTWLCEDGQWVQHGSPSTPPPSTGCGVTPTTVVEITSSPVITAQVTQKDDLNQDIIKEAFSKKYGQPIDKYIIAISTNTGTHAKGSVSFTDEMGGGIWFAAKTEKGWELVADGQGPVLCSVADSYAFPSSLIPECIDALNGNNLKTR
jgi:hypothetical protein